MLFIWPGERKGLLPLESHDVLLFQTIYIIVKPLFAYLYGIYESSN
jgi:hypothetical protein